MPLIEDLTCCKERGQLTRWSKTDEKSVAETKLAKIKLYYFVNHLLKPENFTEYKN
jgi:hypothetical protein